MGKFQHNDFGSVVLHHRPTTTDSGRGNFKLWSSCGRKIIDTMRCGGGGGSRPQHTAQSPVAEKERKTSIPECRSDMIKNNDSNHKGSEKLSELLRMPEEERKKVEAFEELKRVVKRLQSGGDDDVLGGAREVRALAKEDSEARTTLASLGAIPPLVGMLDSDHLYSHTAALYALLNLGIGNDGNKAAIVKAGAVHKMLDLIESPSESLPNPDVSAAIVANFLGLSALDSNKPIIGSSGAMSFLVKTLKSLTPRNSNTQVIHDSLRALYNLSILPSNVLPMIEIDGFVKFLVTTLGDPEASDKILMILSNVVSIPEGRKAFSTVPDVFPILVDVLNWMDWPDCQEKVTYILMVMAHKSYGDRPAMIEAGIMSSLLELTLLGSTLAQKRASRILEILRNNKGKQISENYGGGVGAAVSAPLCGSDNTEPADHTEGFSGVEKMMSEESKAVKHLVQQSLHSNMRRIAKRANLPRDFVPSDHFKSLATFSTSKSLPF